MADPVVSVLLEMLVTFLIDEGSQLLEFEDQLDEIREEFQYMQNYVKDADRVKRRDRSATLRQIMNDVRELIYYAEEIIADCQFSMPQEKETGMGIHFLVSHPFKIPLRFGKKVEGMGGIGKTTLARKICKSEMIETQFKPLIFVTVSQSFRFDELLKKMLNKVDIADGSLQDKGEDDLLKMLKVKLDGSRLELSYEELPTNVKPCFLCCAVYPEDYTIASFRIIQMWIAEGLVWGRKVKTASEMGEECFNEIHNRCLISKVEEGRFDRGLAVYKMHDAVWEMLIKIATLRKSDITLNGIPFFDDQIGR